MKSKQDLQLLLINAYIQPFLQGAQGTVKCSLCLFLFTTTLCSRSGRERERERKRERERETALVGLFRSRGEGHVSTTPSPRGLHSPRKVIVVKKTNAVRDSASPLAQHRVLRHMSLQACAQETSCTRSPLKTFHALRPWSGR